MSFKRGVSFFLAMSVAGVIGVFFFTASPADLPEIAERLDVGWVLLCVLGVPVFDWLVAGARMYLFARVVTPEVSYLACARNCAVGAFMGAATPSQTGGGVAQTYVLVKEGATVGQALAVLFMTFLSTLVFYFVAAVGLWIATATGTLPWVEASWPFVIAVGLFGSLSALGLYALAHPSGAKSALRRLTAWLERWRLKATFAAKINDAFAECSDSLELLVRHHKLRFLVSVGFSVLVFGNKYFSAYLATRALGLDPPLVELLAIQVFINVLLYFFPTPGGSGGAEVSAAVLMARLVPDHLLGPFTILWRTATMYLSVVVGGFILLRYLKRDAVSDEAEAIGPPAEAVAGETD